ncbi:PFL_4669 family integrating conjugative element protein [Gilliamella sp. ESL0250]|uniref:PFL_4669 family integrating conjugative element protein n=1 Tax=Gilliamella sp. ESL0250 TaxID=2705036 RepID=UPI001580258A|nr:TIGR03761 family integrating conjugative element protein [Gilliamella sp. ESL0250]NUF49560.1 TIGR03761 family integrating conjugative element protein [Gilliamella sp. ESL0250]
METIENNQVGVLRSDIKIELHTVPAIQIWYGRKKTDDKHPIQSMTRAIAYLKVIEIATRLDDPYADIRLTKFYEHITKIEKLLDVENYRIDETLKSVPPGFKISDATSVKPVDLNLFINVPSGYQLVFLLCKFDLFVRKVQLAKHISLIKGGDASDRQNMIAHELRSLITYITKYKRTGVTRKDFVDNTPLATKAIEQLGIVPEEILNADKMRDRTVSITN